VRLAVPLLLLAACSSADEAAAPTSAAPKGAAPPATPPASAPVVLPDALTGDAEKALGDQYLVVLASKRSPDEGVPAVAKLREHPEVATTPARITASHFKNLMPCWTITIAGAAPDEAGATKLSAALKGLGIESYVKNAGAYIGALPAIDAYCSRSAVKPSGAARVLASVESKGTVPRLWLPLHVSDAVLTNAARTGPPLRALNETFDAWYSPVKLGSVGSVAVGATYDVWDVSSGTTRSCDVGEIAAMTLGTPHSSVLQAGPPKAPACGEEDLYASLDCKGELGEGPWVAVAHGASATGSGSGSGTASGVTPVAYTPEGDATAAQKKAAEDALAKLPEWTAKAPEGDVTRSVTVTRWTGGGRELLLVQGERSWGKGVCGGGETELRGLFEAAPEGLGAVVSPLRAVEFSKVVGVFDADGDGTPEYVTRTFPGDVAIEALDGTARDAFAFGYCDCGC
jgi:hypothetical protein